MARVPDRFPLLVTETGDSCVDDSLDAVRVTTVGGGGGGNVVVTDIEDGAGTSVMDPANNAIRVNIIAGAGSGGTAMTDSSPFTEGVTNFTPIGGEFQESPADPSAGEAAAARITAKRAVHINLRNVAGAEVGTGAAPVRTDPTGTTAQPVTDNGGSLTVDGTVSISGTVAVDQVDAASLDYDTGVGTVNQTVLGIALPGAGGPVAGGTGANPVRTDPTGTTAQPVTDNGGSLTVDGAVAVTGGSILVTDIEDGAGDSVMDAANNAIRVNIVAGAGSGGTAMTDATAFTEGVTSFTPVGGVFNDALGGDLPEDQAGAARMTRRRAVHVNLRDNDGVQIGTAGAPVRTDPTGSTAQPVTDNGGSLTVDGTVAVSSVAGTVTVAGTVAVSSVSGTVTVAGTVAVSGIAGTVTVDQVDTASLDYDTGAGTVNQTILGIALPGAGGPVAGGTATNPVRTDPTGTTAQPVTDSGGSLTVDGTVAVSAVGGTVTIAGTVTANQGTSPWVVGDGGSSLTVDTPQLPAALVGGRLDVNIGNTPTVDTELPAAALMSDAMANPTAPAVAAHGASWNEEQSDWGRVRESTRVTLLTSGARLVDTASSLVPTYNFRRLALIVNITANIGGISVRPQLQIQDLVTGNWVTIWQANSNLTSQDTFAFLFGDGASGGAWRQVTAFGIPGANFRFNMVSNNGNSVTYSVSAHLMV